MSAHTPGCHHGEPLTPPAKIATWLPCPLCDAAEDLLAALKAILASRVTALDLGIALQAGAAIALAEGGGA